MANEGAYCRPTREPCPVRKPASCEEVLQKPGVNAWIVLGRDRPASIAGSKEGLKAEHPMGYGVSPVNDGQGGERANMIDLCVGLGALPVLYARDAGEEIVSAYAQRKLNFQLGGNPLLGEEQLDPDFIADAARIYISQKADIDRYLFGEERNLCPAKPGNTSIISDSGGWSDGAVTTIKTPKSAVALKADVVRIAARENIKIVAMSDKKFTQFNSQGSRTTKHGIDLIAGPAQNMPVCQPLVKGDNLVNCLKSMIRQIDGSFAAISGISAQLDMLSKAVMVHDHVLEFQLNVTQKIWKSFPALLDALPGPIPKLSLLGKTCAHQQILNLAKTIPNCMVGKNNLVALTKNYLMPNAVESIRSEYNRTT